MYVSIRGIARRAAVFSWPATSAGAECVARSVGLARAWVRHVLENVFLRIEGLEALG
jgi:hypothetical protein